MKTQEFTKISREMMNQVITLANHDIELELPSGHPYLKIIEDAAVRFPHCTKEVKVFFYLENKRNQNPTEHNASVMQTRALEWALFWEGIKQVELDRHNAEVDKKKAEKKARKGRHNDSKSGFKGPSYVYAYIAK